jgi:hypothetical protein
LWPSLLKHAFLKAFFPQETDLMSRLFTLVLVAALVFAGAAAGRADLIAITLGGATFNPLRDSVTLTPRTFSLDLTPNVPLTTLLQSGAFTARIQTMTVNETFPGTLSQSVTADGGAATLSQPISVEITQRVDTMRIENGPSTLLDLGALRRLEITPLGTNVSRTLPGTSGFNLQGTFRLFTVPEPSALVLLSLGLLRLIGYRWRRRS